MWFVNFCGPNFGRISGSGEITYFSFPKRARLPGGIATGPDGNLWAAFNEQVARVTTAGQVTLLPAPPGML